MTAFDFQLPEHLSFRIVRHGSSQQQSFGKVSLIITFEHVFIGEISEHGDGLVQRNVNLEVGFLRQF